VLVITTLFALPFVQWFAFLQFQTRLSFLIPLAIAGGLMFVVSAFDPRFVPAEPLNRVNQREAGLRVTILAAALIISFILPSSGMITLIRGVLSDILALVGVAYLIRAFQKTRKLKVVDLRTQCPLSTHSGRCPELGFSAAAPQSRVQCIDNHPRQERAAQRNRGRYFMIAALILDGWKNGLRQQAQASENNHRREKGDEISHGGRVALPMSAFHPLQTSGRCSKTLRCLRGWP
jgi:hypothetical protein